MVYCIVSALEPQSPKTLKGWNGQSFDKFFDFGNFVRFSENLPHKRTLRRPDGHRGPCSPAMAAGLAELLWTIREWIRYGTLGARRMGVTVRENSTDFAKIRQKRLSKLPKLRRTL